MPLQTRRLATILLEAEVVTQAQIDAALERQRSTGLRIGATLVEMGAATEEDLGWALANQLGCPFVDLRPETLDLPLIRSFPEGVLQRLIAVPLVSDATTITMALADPTDHDVVAELEQVTGRALTPAVATASAIRRTLADLLGPGAGVAATPHEPAPTEMRDRTGAHFLATHVQDALAAGATEIHFVPNGDALETHHRISGRLVRVGDEPLAMAESLLARIAALGGPALHADDAHVSGHLRCPLGTESVALDASVLRRGDGAAVTLVFSDQGARVPALEDLGLDPVDLARLRATLDGGHGLGLVCGPPGSGGSTTLLSLLAHGEGEGRRCLVFGRAAQRVRPSQRAIESAAGAARTWREAVVGQCADVVGLGHVVGAGAVTDLLGAAAFGRMVIARTDWLDSFALLEELSRKSADRSALAARLRFVIQQRMIAADAGSPGASPASRRCVFEVLIAGDRLRAAILAGAPAAGLRAAADADGFTSLSVRLADAVQRGLLGADQAARSLA